MEAFILGIIAAIAAICLGYIAEGERFLKSFSSLPNDPMFQRLVIVSYIMIVITVISKVVLEKLKNR